MPVSEQERRRRMRAGLAEMRALVEGGGWTVQAVMPSPHFPQFMYTIGLWHNFRHPEVLITGNHPAMGAYILQTVAVRVSRGERFDDGVIDYQLAETEAGDMPMCFRSIRPEHVPAKLGFAYRVYDRATFEAVQCYWPDTLHAFPWEASFDDKLTRLEPMLHNPRPDYIAADDRPAEVVLRCTNCPRGHLAAVGARDWLEFSSPGRTRYIQDIFPYLDPAVRGLMNGGFCPACVRRAQEGGEEDVGATEAPA